MDDTDSRLTRIAADIDHSSGTPFPALAIRSLLIGALYSLIQARRFGGYQARSGQALDEKYDNELRETAQALAEKKLPENRLWLAAYFFGNAQFRLAVTYERVLKLLVGREDSRYELENDAVTRKLISQEHVDSLARVFRDFNRTKHHSDVMADTERIHTIEEAVTIAELLSDLIRGIEDKRDRESN